MRRERPSSDRAIAAGVEPQPCGDGETGLDQRLRNKRGQERERILGIERFSDALRRGDSALAECDDLDGKILVDCTNAYDFANRLAPLVPADQSAARIIAQKTKATVVKCFNQVGAEAMASAGQGTGRPLQFVSSYDEGARGTIIELALGMGFDARDAGPLDYARELEGMARLWIAPRQCRTGCLEMPPGFLGLSETDSLLRIKPLGYEELGCGLALDLLRQSRSEAFEHGLVEGTRELDPADMARDPADDAFDRLHPVEPDPDALVDRRPLDQLDLAADG